MISPHTPPGTKVVCIDARSCPPLVDGAEYTVARISFGYDEHDLFGPSMFGVILVEVSVGQDFDDFDPHRFRRAVLPSCLTEILNRAPVKQTERV